MSSLVEPFELRANFTKSKVTRIFFYSSYLEHKVHGVICGSFVLCSCHFAVHINRVGAVGNCAIIVSKFDFKLKSFKPMLKAVLLTKLVCLNLQINQCVFDYCLCCFFIVFNMRSPINRQNNLFLN